MAPSCSDCGGTVIEYDQAAGNGFCVNCGTVVEENTIVNEISFGEASTGAAIVQGSFVGHGATHARMSGPYGNRGSNESREQTIANAGKKIQSIANVLRLSEVVCLAATRLYTLAVEHKFTKGRKSLNVVAVCLYVACRQKETRNYMLIDFSDLLQVNVFELGHTYLQLVQTLNLRLPLVDPSHYISRFSALLEFGDETHKVATDAVRLVQRFDRDWMTRGRRPAGICGAALLLAARMNNFRRSVEEIVQVVKIADTTLKKRLDEFKNTPSGALTLADFRSVWLEEEMDPPAFTKGRQREEAEKMLLAHGDDADGDEGEAGPSGAGTGKSKGKAGKKGGKKRKGKRKRGVDDEGEDNEPDPDHQQPTTTEPPPPVHPTPIRLDPETFNQSILAGSIDPSTFDPNIDPALFNQPSSSSIPLIPSSSSTAPFLPTDPLLLSSIAHLPPPDPIDESLSTALAEEVSTFLTNEQGTRLLSALDEAEERRLAKIREAHAQAEARAEAVKRARERARDQTQAPVPEQEQRHLPIQTSPSDMDPSLGAISSLTHDPTQIQASGSTLVGTQPPISSVPVSSFDRIDAHANTNSNPNPNPIAYPNPDPDTEDIDELTGLDEDELDRMLLSPDEVKIKERVWVELNKDYLEALAAKNEQMDQMGGSVAKSRKRRKTATKPRDSTTAAGDTPAESVRNLIKKNPKYSKRINYDALKDLFVENGGLSVPGSGAGATTTSNRNGGPTSRVFPASGFGMDDEKDDEVELFLMDDKEDDDEFMLGGTGVGRGGSVGARTRKVQVIVEESNGLSLTGPKNVDGGQSSSAAGNSGKKKQKGVLGMMGLNAEGEDDASEDEDDEDEDDAGGMGWEDAYEQEI